MNFYSYISTTTQKDLKLSRFLLDMSEIVNASDALELDTGHVPKIANTAQNHRMFLHIKYEIVQNEATYSLIYTKLV